MYYWNASIGTSLTASWLSSHGLKIDLGNIIDPSVGNTKGHFEDKDFVDFHSGMLQKVNPKSDGWKIFKNEIITFSKQDVLEAKKIAERRNKTHENWGWKSILGQFYF